MCNVGRDHYEEHFFAIILNLHVVHMLFEDISYLQLWWSFCSAEQDNLCNFDRRNYEEHFCDVILNLDQCFMEMSFRIFIIYSSSGHLVRQNRTI